jgi:hypothetical protein
MNYNEANSNQSQNLAKINPNQANKLIYRGQTYDLIISGTIT